MSSAAASFAPGVPPAERLEGLFDKLEELTGQRNAIDGQIVDIVAEIDRDELWGATGARSIAALVAWKTGVSPHNAKTIATIAHRLPEFPRCVAGMREGRFSLDQVGAIADDAADGSDAHYAQMAAVSTVNQLRTAIKLEPRPKPEPRPEPRRSISKTGDESPARGGSPCRTTRPPRSTPPSTPTATRWSPTGNATTPTATLWRRRRRRCRTPSMRS
jgi:Domain of unknown function (DUF222)